MPSSYSPLTGAPETAPGAQVSTASSYSGQSIEQHGPLEAGTTKPSPVGRWVLHWRSPATMTGFFVLATVLAIGHHVYYDNLHGTEVMSMGSKWDMSDVGHGQEWTIRFGTAFAFLVKTMFASAVTVAFEQHVWLTARRKAITVSGLDAMFLAARDPISFTSLDFLRKAKSGAVLALLVWLIPLAAVITPATLTVVPSTSSFSKTLPVPSINFSEIEPLFDASSSVMKTDGYSAHNGITPYMTRLVASTASSLQILPMNVAIANASYNMTFHGPSLRCHKPSTLTNQAILMMLNATWFVAYNGDGQTMDDKFENFNSPISWLAFPPNSRIMSLIGQSQVHNRPLTDSWMEFLAFAVACVAQPSMLSTFLPTFESLPLCEGVVGFPPGVPLKNVTAVSPEEKHNLGRLWIWAQNTTYDCVLTDTEYRVRFFYSASEKLQRVDPVYSFSWTEDDLHGSYFSTANALANLLSGAIRSFYTGTMSYKTRVTETAVFGALETGPDSNDSTYSGFLAPALLPPDIKALAQNKSVGELVEELSRNVTLSLFSADKILARNETTVEIVSNVNVYAYSRYSLILTYGVTFFAALVALVVGCAAYIQNGVSHEVSFSAFMSTTRNPQLDELIVENSMGALPLSKKIEKTELRFGLLRNKGEHAKAGVGNDGIPRRIGFGLENENQVIVLEKGAPYY